MDIDRGFFYRLTSHNNTYIADTQDVSKWTSLSAQVETDFDQILKSHPHYTSFTEIGTWNAIPSEDQMDVDREPFYPLTSHDATDMQDVPKWTSQSAHVVKGDFNRIFNAWKSQSNESALTMQSTSTITGPFFAIQNVSAGQQTEIIIYQPKPVRAFNLVPQLMAALTRRTPSPPLDTSRAALNRTPSSLNTSGQCSFFPSLDEYPLLTHPNSRVHLLFMFYSSEIAQGQFSTQQITPFVPAQASEPITPKQTRRTFSFRAFSPEDDTIWLSPSPQKKQYHISLFVVLICKFSSLSTLPPFRRYFLNPLGTLINRL